VEVTLSAYADMQAIVAACEIEVGWLAGCEKVGSIYRVTGPVMVPEQDCHGATTEISPEGLVKCYEGMSVDAANRIRCWGHSHVQMSVSPSVQDEETLEQLAGQAGDFFLSIIVNKAGEVYAGVIDWTVGWQFSDVPVRILWPETETDWAAEVAAKVKEKEIYAGSARGFYRGLGLFDNYNR